MTIKQQYEEMKQSLKEANECFGFDKIHRYPISIHSHKGKKMLIELIVSDYKMLEKDFELNIITQEIFYRKRKVLQDCMRTANKIEIW